MTVKDLSGRIVGICLLVSVGLSSCVVGKKKYDAEVAERLRAQKQLNDCHKQAAALKTDTTNAGKNFRDLSRRYSDLNKRYSDLDKKTSEQITSGKITNEQLSTALRNKEAELNEKARLLAEREKMVQELQDLLRRKEAAAKELLDKVKGALAGFKADELTVELKNGLVYVSLSDKLLFKSGSTAVDKKGQEALGKLAAELNKNPDIQIQIEGHTDNVPIKTAQFSDNWDLSVLRATSIVRLLTREYKVEPTRLLPSGRSEFFPKADNTTAEGKGRNRRTEIILSPNLDELYKLLEGK